MADIIFTMGDSVDLTLTVVDFDLTGAVLTTYMKSNSGRVSSFGNEKHTINPDQITNKGKFVLSLSSDDTELIGVGEKKEIITKIQQGSSIVHARASILTVKPKEPIS